MPADAEDVEAHLGRPLTPAEENRLPGLAAEAAALIEGWVGAPIPDPAPAGITIAAGRMIARALTATAPAGVTQTAQTAGPFHTATTWTPEATTGGVWLGRQDKLILRRYLDRRATNTPTH